MRTLALAENIRTVGPSAISRQSRKAKNGGALEGVLVFTGISLTLAALAFVFHALNLPPAFLL